MTKENKKSPNSPSFDFVIANKDPNDHSKIKLYSFDVTVTSNKDYIS